MHHRESNTRERVLHGMTVWFVLGAGALLALTYAGSGVGEPYIADVGLVQTLTLLTLAAAACAAATLAVRHPANRLNLGLLACGLTIYAGREHDLHRLSCLPEHFTRWQFYAMDVVPVWQKIGFGLLLLAIATVIGLFLYRMTQPFLQALKHSQSWAMLAMAWLMTLTVSQISDRTWLNDTFAGRAFEEIAELIAAGLAISVVSFFPRQQNILEIGDPPESSKDAKAPPAKLA